MDIEAIGIAQAYADKLLAGVTSGIASTSVDEENNSITFNFKDGTEQTMVITTPQAKVNKAVDDYLANNNSEELKTKLDELIEGRA